MYPCLVDNFGLSVGLGIKSRGVPQLGIHTFQSIVQNLPKNLLSQWDIMKLNSPKCTHTWVSNSAASYPVIVFLQGMGERILLNWSTITNKNHIFSETWENLQQSLWRYFLKVCLVQGVACTVQIICIRLASAAKNTTPNKSCHFLLHPWSIHISS